jgi:hypothetical protein
MALEHHAAVQAGAGHFAAVHDHMPALASSSPASTLRMVVLPQPEWPMMQTNSPLSM